MKRSPSVGPNRTTGQFDTGKMGGWGHGELCLNVGVLTGGSNTDSPKHEIMGTGGAEYKRGLKRYLNTSTEIGAPIKRNKLSSPMSPSISGLNILIPDQM